MVSLSITCAWCSRPLLDPDHARAHGPLCDRNPTVPAARASALLDAAEIADTEASGTLRLLAAVALERLR